jgi:FkbM family methyltransferase
MPSLRQRIAFWWRLPGGYRWHMLLRKLGKRSARIERNGKPFIAPLDASAGVALIYPVEKWMAPLLKRLLPLAPGTFVDVGANIGQTLLWLRSVDEQRPWIGFEPSPEACKAARRLIEINRFQNTTLIEAGLSDRAGSATLHAGGGTDSSATMRTPGPQQDVQTTVKLLNGADLADKELAQPVGILKVDVEGMELEVIRGLRAVIQRDRPLIIFETLPAANAESRDRQQALASELKSQGYRLAHVGLDARLHEVDAPQAADTSDCNFLAVPAQRFDEVLR